MPSIQDVITIVTFAFVVVGVALIVWVVAYLTATRKKDK